MIEPTEGFVPFFVPPISRDEIDEVVDTLESGWITTGPKTKEFERRFAEAFDAPDALALNSCTAALHLSLKALPVREGDEVIVPSMTFAASANVVEHVGARPVIVDVEPDTLNLCPDAVEAAITERTRALMVVHFAGHPAEMSRLRDIARARALHIIEDAAHAVHARYRGEWVGGTSNPAAFSFYATKNLTTGEGGMLTGSEDFIDRARVWALHGMSRNAWQRYGPGQSWFYEITVPGFKYNMTDIQASLGLHQLRRLAGFQRRRREIWERYDAAFSSCSGLETPTIRSDVEHAYHLYVLRLRRDVLPFTREEFIAELGSMGIGTSVHFIPLHLHAFYAGTYGLRPGDCPIAKSSYERAVSLPLYPTLTDDAVERVVQAVTDLASSFDRAGAD